jgi:hypothetical protein
LENSQMVAPESPDICHLPTIVEFPQPAIAHSKTAKAIICKLGVIGTASKLTTYFDTVKPFSSQSRSIGESSESSLSGIT